MIYRHWLLLMGISLGSTLFGMENKNQTTNTSGIESDNNKQEQSPNSKRLTKEKPTMSHSAPAIMQKEDLHASGIFAKHAFDPLIAEPVAEVSSSTPDETSRAKSRGQEQSPKYKRLPRGNAKYLNLLSQSAPEVGQRGYLLSPRQRAYLLAKEDFSALILVKQDNQETIVFAKHSVDPIMETSIVASSIMEEAP